jgi:hypothetical protein
MANSQNPSDRPRRGAAERGGVGQSGYTAGRERDPALDRGVDTRNVSHPKLDDDGLGTDDRFTGRGGTVPEDDAPARPGQPDDT